MAKKKPITSRKPPKKHRVSRRTRKQTQPPLASLAPHFKVFGRNIRQIATSVYQNVYNHGVNVAKSALNVWTQTQDTLPIYFNKQVAALTTTVKTTRKQFATQSRKISKRWRTQLVKKQTQWQTSFTQRVELERAYVQHLADVILPILTWPVTTVTIKKRNGATKKTGVIFQRSRWSMFVLKVKALTLPTRRQRFWKQFTKNQTQRAYNLYQSISSFLLTPSQRISQPKSRKTKAKAAQTIVARFGTRQWFYEYGRHLVKKYWLTVTVSLIITGAIIGSAYGGYVFIFQDLPSVTELTDRPQPTTTRIKDRHGEVLYRIYEDENRTLIPLQQLPTHVVQATIAIEDQSFYSHQGFSVKGIIRAFLANLEGKSVQGGSTITQQLVKNRLLSPERTLQRKVRELLLSVMVDASYSKDQILEMYFNQVAYGGSTYGIEEAAQMYFGKSARDLNLAEGAMLAGLPAAPSVYSPFGPHPELAYARQEEVLRRMVVEQFITEEQANLAQQEILQFRPNRIDIKAPHFVMYVKQLLAEKFGEHTVEQGGLEVTTTLDLPFHDNVQKLVTDEVAELARLRVSNGAAVVTRPGTGEVLSMVGSKDYFDFEHDGQVNVALRPRQPGSSIKPLTYAVAMERGRTPYSIIADTPISYHQPGSKPYAPKNYDGKFHGNVTLKQALASSYNIPAVKLLAEVGINTVIDKGTAMGISTWSDRSRFGLSLTLGGGEVLMTDMMELYGTFANNGYTVDLNPLLEVKDAQGKVLYRNTCALDNVGCPRQKNLDERVAFQITQMLSDNTARTPAFGPRSVLHIPNQQVAVKTGTTNNLRDNWTFGYTSDILVGVWVGNNNNTSMSYVASGVTGASPIWNNIIRLTLDDTAPHVFTTPEGLVTVKICAQTGTLTCSGCPTTIDASFVPGTEPQTACNPAYFRPKPKPNPNDPNAANSGDPNRDQILEGFTIGN